MMLYRREGLIPAARRAPALTLEEQTVQPAHDGRPLALPPSLAEDQSAGMLLEIADLTVRFGGLVALRSVELSVPAQSVVAVIGPNGSGKSTLFNAVTGLVPARGNIRFAGNEIGRLRSDQVLERGIARTFQNIRLFPNLTVLENIMIGMHAQLATGPLAAVLRPPATRREEAAARERALAILALFGNRLLPRAEHPAASLSYANRRRTEIARALAARPKL
jgi:branched-chain amino acid transport system permease protein